MDNSFQKDNNFIELPNGKVIPRAKWEKDNDKYYYRSRRKRALKDPTTGELYWPEDYKGQIPYDPETDVLEINKRNRKLRLLEIKKGPDIWEEKGIDIHGELPSHLKQELRRRLNQQAEEKATITAKKLIPAEIAQEINTIPTVVEKSAVNKALISKLSTTKVAWGAGAAALFGIYALARKSHKQEISPRHRDAIVQEHPNFNENRSIMRSVSMLGAISAGMGIVSRKGSPTVRASLAIGGAALLGLGATYKKNDPVTAVLGISTAGAAATLAYVLSNKYKTIGLQTLRNFVSKQGPKSTIDNTIAAISNVKKNFPGISGLISAESVALGAGLVTLPAVHSIMVKHFAAERRRNTDHGEVSFLPAWQDNKAGYQGLRKTNSPLFAYNPSNSAEVNFNGSVNSYYDSASVFEGV